MAIDDGLNDRIRNILTQKGVSWEEKRMFGGLCFMIDDKMAFGSKTKGLMVRVAPEEADELLARGGATPMHMGKKTMTGFLYVDHEAIDREDDLEFWVQKTLDYNPRAKSSKKKQKKK